LFQGLWCRTRRHQPTPGLISAESTGQTTLRSFSWSLCLPLQRPGNPIDTFYTLPAVSKTHAACLLTWMSILSFCEHAQCPSAKFNAIATNPRKSFLPLHHVLTMRRTSVLQQYQRRRRRHEHHNTLAEYFTSCSLTTCSAFLSCARSFHFRCGNLEVFLSLETKPRPSMGSSCSSHLLSHCIHHRMAHCRRNHSNRSPQRHAGGHTCRVIHRDHDKLHQSQRGQAASSFRVSLLARWSDAAFYTGWKAVVRR
jgi:hypothetical protein